MDVLTIKIPGVIPNGIAPQQYVLADVWNGEATVLRVNGHDEDIDDLIRAAPHYRQMRVARNKRLDNAKRNG